MVLCFWYAGLVVSTIALWRVGWWVYSTFFRKIDLKKYSKGQSWAAVTGSTDGIGLAYALVLAEHGFNILLISRSQEKLEAVKARISKASKVQVDYVVNDANDISEANIQKVVDKVGSRDLAILVNNVGIGQGGVKLFSELNAKQIEECIRVNCTYPTLLTQKLTPTLLRHIGPKLMINVSSVAALLMNPYAAVYSGSKAFNKQFSRALSAEFSQNGMDVLCVEPGFVESNMTKMKANIVCCTARECVESSLRKIGDIEIVPHWKHTLVYGIANLCHELVPNIMVSALFLRAVTMLRQYTGPLHSD